VKSRATPVAWRDHGDFIQAGGITLSSRAPTVKESSRLALAVLGVLLAAGALPAAEAPRRDTYMAFGDSITDGAGSSDETGYRGPLERMLKERFGRAVVVNEGRPGADTRGGARAVAAALLRHRPAVTLVMFGTNDWRDDPKDPPSASATVNGLRKIVRAAKAGRSRPFLATIPPTNTGFDANVPAARNEWVLRTNARIRELAREEHVAMVDVHAAMVAQGPLASLFADGVHPNDAGYTVIAKAFLDALVAEASGARQP
jgi:lysophospholipase L1-like esterase